MPDRPPVHRGHYSDAEALYLQHYVCGRAVNLARLLVTVAGWGAAARPTEATCRVPAGQLRPGSADDCRVMADRISVRPHCWPGVLQHPGQTLLKAAHFIRRQAGQRVEKTVHGVLEGLGGGGEGGTGGAGDFAARGLDGDGAVYRVHDHVADGWTEGRLTRLAWSISIERRADD